MRARMYIATTSTMCHIRRAISVKTQLVNHSIVNCGLTDAIVKQWQASKIGTASEKRTKCLFPKCPLFGGSTVVPYY